MTHAATGSPVTIPPTPIPTRWYNACADYPEPLPPHLNPGTKEPVTEADLHGLFPTGLAAQELSQERWIEIPAEVREAYAMWRPAPLIRALRLEREVGTKARIYYKYEGASPIGSHKANTAIAQVYYNAADGATKLTTETGAGQWGAALAYACALYGLECEVFQVRATYDAKPLRRFAIETYGGTIHPSPSDLTNAGRELLKDPKNHPGSLGMAVSEAIEVALGQEGANYSLGSVLNHVVIHQSVIGLETIEQLTAYGENGASIVFGCAGGGSNLGGLALPFLQDAFKGGTGPRIVAAEPAACPSITGGEYRYDHGDTAGFTPLLKMYTLGNAFVPDSIHAGGLRYHGMAPMVSHAINLGFIEGVALDQREAFAAGVLFARTEGIIPAPESCHAIAAALTAAREAADDDVYVIGLSGHGQVDLSSYHAYLAGEIPATS